MSEWAKAVRMHCVLFAVMATHFLDPVSFASNRRIFTRGTVEDDDWNTTAAAELFRVASEPADTLSATGMVVEGEAGGGEAAEAIV